jgi:hypothetical protein
MIEKRNMHLRVQEMCDCYATSDPLAEMEKMETVTGDVEELSIKWLALAILHGINSGMDEIKISLDNTECVRVKSEHPKAELPAPDPRIAEGVMEVIREITHIEADKGRMPISVGVRDSSLDFLVKVKSRADRDKISLVFNPKEHYQRHGDDDHQQHHHQSHNKDHHGHHHHESQGHHHESHGESHDHHHHESHREFEGHHAGHHH